ncbi:MAG: NAD(P)H-binding protein [Taibaiella sp.]|nr:NAD(P)H-binding protein [Taibaiella sp.]
MSDKKISIVLTGATGMVGEGVLEECLQHAQVEWVLIINRKPAGISHPKLKELIQSDLADISSIKEKVKGYDACLFCLGISSVGISADDYYKTTYTLTLGFAKTLAEVNPDMVFEYVSGENTDSSEKGNSRWARVKGKTENDLMKLFKNAYGIRPGMIKPNKGQKRVHKLYYAFAWLYPVLKTFFKGAASTMHQLGQAMIKIALDGNSKKILEVRDINALGEG